MNSASIGAIFKLYHSVVVRRSDKAKTLIFKTLQLKHSNETKSSSNRLRSIGTKRTKNRTKAKEILLKVII